MWTTSKIRTLLGDREGAAAAARYVLEKSDSPLAYSVEGTGGEDPKAIAYWLGADGALGQLGLTPGQEVIPRDLELALQGRGTDGGQVRRPGFIERPVRGEDGKVLTDEDGKAITERQLGVVTYKFTLSLPKSFSIVWALADEELKRELERDVIEAWNLAAEHLVRGHNVVMDGRKDGERSYVPATGFAAAVSLHSTSRKAKDDPAPAPQLHAEGIMIGATRPSDGKLVALNGAAIYGDAALEAGAYGRAHVAERLVQRGFRIRRSTGRDGSYFEIAGISEELIDDFSGRSKEVAAAAREAEREIGRQLSNRERSGLALLTRSAKEDSPEPVKSLFWWRRRALDRGLGPKQYAELRGTEGFELSPAEARGSLAEAVEHTLRMRGPTVTHTAAQAVVMSAAPGRMGVAEAEAMVAELQAKGALLPLSEKRVTSPSIRTEEERVVEVLTAIGEREPQAYSAAALEAGEEYAAERLPAGAALSPEQRDAIQGLGQGAGWSVLSARAGAGKTAVLQAIAEAHRQEGGEVLACSIDWRTAQELGRGLGTRPLSLRRAIRWARRGKVTVDERTLIVIEEAGKVGLPQWRQLAELAKDTGARVLAVGHAGQMGAVELPGMFEVMVERKGLVEVVGLADILRHEHKWMADLQVAIDTGDGPEAVRILLANKALTFHASHEEAVEATVSDWFEAQRQHGSNRASMIIQGSNLEIDEANAAAQERRRAEGELPGERVDLPGRPYGFYAGDQVVLRGAAYRFAEDEFGNRARTVENGTAGIIQRVDPEGKRIWVEVSEPGHPDRVVEIDLDRPAEEPELAWKELPEDEGLTPETDFGPPSWRLAYAMHSNFTQGMSIWSVDHLGGHPSQDRESSYVALSRQISELRDHVNTERLGETEAEWIASYARVLETSRRRHASIRYDLNPGAEIASEHTAAGCHVLPAGVHEFETAREAPARQSLFERFDPLAPFRTALGEERSAWVEARAAGYAGAVAQMNPETRAKEHEKATKAFARLDREGALETLALQRERQALEEEITLARNHAETLGARALELERRDEREERQALEEHAAAQRRHVNEGLAERSDLLAEEEALRKDERHLDGWMEENGELAARAIALERGLFADRGVELEAEIDAALKEPPERLTTRLGPAPDPGTPARQQWEDFAFELEANRLIVEGELIAPEPGGRDLASLDRRIERWGEERGIDLGGGAEVARW